MSSLQLAEVGFSGTASVEQRLIQSLCPPGTVVAAGTGAEVGLDLFPIEEVAVAKATGSRRHEFAHGRACARRALRRLGVSPGPIPVQPDRAPAWPTGVVGSIAHTAGLVCAVVGRSQAVAGVGVDIESRDRPMREKLERFIRTPAERVHQQSLSADLDPLRLVFSAKEAVHKCVAPLSGVTLGFHDVELDFDVASGSFRARLVKPRDRALPDFETLLGRFAVTHRFVITTAVIRAGCSGHTTLPSTSVAV
jgi:4'-phosphopantetheinyl transferase EntD